MRYYKSGSVLCLLAAMLIVSCGGSDENKVHYENKLFISGTNTVQELRVSEEDRSLASNISIGMGQPESRDITTGLSVAADLVEHFREAYYEPTAEILPAGHYNLSGVEMKIEAGKVVSNPLNIEFTGLEGLDMEKTYVLPVSLTGANVDVLEGMGTRYFLFKKASLVNVVAEVLGPKEGDREDTPDNKLWPGPKDWNDPSPVRDMSAFTMEALVNVHQFSNREIATVMGIEDKFLIRIGDAGIPKNQLQVAWGKEVEGSVERAHITNSSLQLAAGQWYHIAVTFDNGDIVVYLDGQKKGEDTSDFDQSIDFSIPHSDEMDGKPRCFWISYSYDKWRSLNGLISEVRIWDRALSADEIRSENHFYKVAPDSDGLVAYWKFDEGAGDIVKDYTSYGNDLYSALPLKWYPVALPAEE